MKITIVGAGRVGEHLAKYLTDEDQDIYLVDSDAEKLAVLESDFNMRTFIGQPTDFNTLREANAENADFFVALTADTSDNLVACAMAKSMGAKRTIARVNRYDFVEPINEGVVRRMGVDNIVYPDLSAAKAIINSLAHPWSLCWNDFDNGAILQTSVAVEEDAPIVGHLLNEFSDDIRLFHISALRRGNATIIPRGTDCIRPGDILHITAMADGISRVMELTGRSNYDIKRVLIMGGSKVAEIIALLAPGKMQVTIIEKNLEKCRELTAKCPDCNIIYGDASEQEVLEEAGIAKCDAFVALSDISEGNILACLAAKESNVPKTVAEIEKDQFIAKAEAFSIGTIINKPIITANAIFQLILDRHADSSKCYAMSDAEVVRLKIREDSYLTSAPIKDLDLPVELTFAGYIRRGKGGIVNGLTCFHTGDEVIVFCRKGALDKVKKLFRK